MNAEQAIAEASRKIDQWVRSKPPPLYYSRFYEWPADLAAIPAPAAYWLDHACPPWRELRQKHPSSMPGFECATRQDAQQLDAAFFESRRQSLLDRANAELSTILSRRLPPPVQCAALTARAYGLAQALLWLDHIGSAQALVAKAWKPLAQLAKQANDALQPDAISEEDWMNTEIRLALVCGWADILADRTVEGVGRFLDVISWYSSAKHLGYSEIVRNRRDDWLQALYAILDFGRPLQETEVWKETACALVKDLAVGKYRVRPLFEATRSTSQPGKLAIQMNASFAGDEWRRAENKLGKDGAFLDLVVTDRWIHGRLHLGGHTIAMRRALPFVLRPSPETEESDRWGRYLVTPASAVFDPLLEHSSQVAIPNLWTAPDANLWAGAEVMEKLHLTMVQLFEQEQGIVPHDAPGQDASLTRTSSEKVRWIGYCQTMHVSHVDGEWSWALKWRPVFPLFESPLWNAIYETVFAEAVKRCEDKGVRRLIVSPDGSLSAVPHHLLRDGQGRRLGDKFSVSYSPNITGLLTVLDAESLDLGTSRVVIVKDPTRTVTLADWECGSVAASAGPFAQVIEPGDGTVEAIQSACEGAGVLHFAGHAHFDWLKPDESYLKVANDAHMGLSDLQALKLRPGSLVFLSACHSGRHGMGSGRASSQGIVSALLQAGVSTVICTLWPIHSLAAALVSHWFYRSLLGEGRGRLESLELATQRLREASSAECAAILGRPVYLMGEKPFADEYYWGGFVLYGAW